MKSCRLSDWKCFSLGSLNLKLVANARRLSNMAGVFFYQLLYINCGTLDRVIQIEGVRKPALTDAQHSEYTTLKLIDDNSLAHATSIQNVFMSYLLPV